MPDGLPGLALQGYQPFQDRLQAVGHLLEPAEKALRERARAVVLVPVEWLRDTKALGDLLRAAPESGVVTVFRDQHEVILGR